MQLAPRSVSGLSPDANAFRLFRAFAEPIRLRLLHLLRCVQRDGGGEVCVCDLVGALGIPQPTVSRHLAHLRAAGLVACRKEGPWCHYRLRSAQGPVHKRLLAMLEVCEADLPELGADARRLRLSGCCPAPEASQALEGHA